jgi:hypothetical protein
MARREIVVAAAFGVNSMPSKLVEARSTAGASIETVPNTASTWPPETGATVGKTEKTEPSMTQKPDDTISSRDLKRQIKLDVRKGMFYNSITPFEMSLTGVAFSVKGKPKLRYMLRRERDVFTGEIRVIAYQGSYEAKYNGLWNWSQLGPNGWKKAVMMMRVWPEWDYNDVS